MKILFGRDITANKKDPTIWGSELTVQTLPNAQAEALGREMNKLENREEYIKLPKVLRWIKFIAMAAALCFFGSVIRAIVDTSFKEAIKGAPWVIYTMLALGVIWGILELIQWARKKLRGTRAEILAQQARVQSLIQNAYATLGVPADAAAVDVLVSRFKVKNEKPSVKGFPLTTFVNPEMRAFTIEGVLYLANTEKKYAIPLEQIKGFHKIKRRASAANWNKEQYLTEPPYDSQKIGLTSFGISFKPYYAMEFEHMGETWRLLIPPYELATFEYLVGKEARQGLFS